MADPDDLFDDTDNVSFDMDDDAHVNNTRSFSYSKKPERYSSFRLDEDDDAEEEPRYEQRAPTPPPSLDHTLEEDVPSTPTPIPISTSEPAPSRRRREDSDDEDDNRGSDRSRFTSERKISLSARTSMSDKVIPDSLDKVTVRTTTGNVGTGINQWKGKAQRKGRPQQQGNSRFGRQPQQPVFNQNNSILHVMRTWDQNGFCSTTCQPMNQINRNMMGINNHNEWFSYHTDSFQHVPYQSWSSSQGYQNHYTSPVQSYSQINMSSPNYGFNRNMRSNMSYMQQPSYHSPSVQPTQNVRARLGPIKRDAPDNVGPASKNQKMGGGQEKHRNLREVDTVNKPEKKEDKKEEEPGVPGETEPPPPTPPKEVDVKELFPETNDEEMSEYMKKIEEQKRKRAMLVREKEMKRMREAQIKLEKQNASQPQPTEASDAAPEKVAASNGPDAKSEDQPKAAEAETPVPNAEPTTAPEEAPKPAVEENKPPVVEEKKPATEEKKPADEDVPGTKLVRVKTRDGKIVVRRVALETLSKMKKLSPAQANETKETVNPKKTVVLVENLSASTTKDQLFNMGKQVGTVLEAEVDGETKSGRIAFENAQLANAFMTKFQRKMVDLSMISLVLATEDELWPPLPTQLEDIE